MRYARPDDDGLGPCKLCGVPSKEHEWRCSACGAMAQHGKCGCGACDMPEKLLCRCKSSYQLWCPEALRKAPPDAQVVLDAELETSRLLDRAYGADAFRGHRDWAIGEIRRLIEKSSAS